MTIIVAVRDSDHVLVGADDRGTSEKGQTFPGVTKVWKCGQLVIGVSGPVRASNLLYDHPQLAAIETTGKDPLTVMTQEVIPIIKTAYTTKAKSIFPWKRKAITAGNWCVIVAFGQSIFLVDPNFAAVPSSRSYMAIGSGQQFACGSLHETEDMLPPVRVRRAIVAASEHDCACGWMSTTITTDPVKNP